MFTKVQKNRIKKSNDLQTKFICNYSAPFIFMNF